MLNNDDTEKRDFPSWHFAMLNDRARNGAIETAINALGVTGKTVFEIGTGSGVIALMFARAGAERVLTCEMNSTLAALAQRTVDRNAFSDRIQVVAMNSSKVIDNGIVDFNPDFIFTETLDCGVVGEGFFSIARDVQRVASASTTVVPGPIKQYGMLIDSVVLHEQNHVTSVSGFDVSELNRYSTPTYFPVRAALNSHIRLSRRHVLRVYDYLSVAEAPVVSIDATADGMVHGVLTWFEAPFGRAVITNAPGTFSHWHQAFHPLEHPVGIAAGEQLTVQIQDCGTIRVI